MIDLHGRSNPDSGLQTVATKVSPTSTLSKVELLGSVERVLCDVRLQVDFFSEVICKALCAFDSRQNYFRSASLSRIQVSILFFSLCRYITAAFLGTKFDRNNTNTLTLHEAQDDLLHRLLKAVTGMEILRMKQLEDVLLAIIMYGLSVNWDGSNDPGYMHYNAAVALLHHASKDQTFRKEKTDSLKFFAQSLVYWRMGLSFVTDVSECPLSDSPVIQGLYKFDDNSTVRQKIIPHPLTGVSPFSQFLLGEVGSLVYIQRKTHKYQPGLRSSNIKEDRALLSEAQRLEQQLLSLSKPQEQDFLDTGDPNTPLHDLINIAEAHRLSGLVLLYRVFPDLLEGRPDLSVDSELSYLQQEDQHLLWISGLAIYILGLLESNDSKSGTRSVEQIILMIVAGELRLPSFCSSGFEPTCSFHQPTWSWLSSKKLITITKVCPQVSPHMQMREKLVSQEPLLDHVHQKDIIEARSVLLKRLHWVRDILPYKSIEKVEELVLETWRISDDDQRNVFWLDVMIDNDWRFLFV